MDDTIRHLPPANDVDQDDTIRVVNACKAALVIWGAGEPITLEFLEGVEVTPNEGKWDHEKMSIVDVVTLIEQASSQKGSTK